MVSIISTSADDWSYCHDDYRMHYVAINITEKQTASTGLVWKPRKINVDHAMQPYARHSTVGKVLLNRRNNYTTRT